MNGSQEDRKNQNPFHIFDAVVSAVLSGDSNAVIPLDALRTAHATASKKSVRELLQDCFVQTDSAFKIFERKIFVRRMIA